MKYILILALTALLLISGCQPETQDNPPTDGQIMGDDLDLDLDDLNMSDLDDLDLDLDEDLII